MTTETLTLYDQIFDALTECADDKLYTICQYGMYAVAGKQQMYDAFMEKLDEILNSKK